MLESEAQVWKGSIPQQDLGSEHVYLLPLPGAIHARAGLAGCMDMDGCLFGPGGGAVKPSQRAVGLRPQACGEPHGGEVALDGLPPP